MQCQSGVPALSTVVPICGALTVAVTARAATSRVCMFVVTACHDAARLCSMDAEASSEPMSILAKLVVLLDDPYDAKKMIRRMTHGDKARLILLKSFLGTVLRPTIGLYNGYYSLDLSEC